MDRVRWSILVALLITHSVSAQWARFEACGFKLPPAESMVPEETQLAPSRGPIYVWVPGVMMVVGYQKFKGPACSKIVTTGHQVFVIGTFQETLETLNNARGSDNGTVRQ